MCTACVRALLPSHSHILVCKIWVVKFFFLFSNSINEQQNVRISYTTKKGERAHASEREKERKIKVNVAKGNKNFIGF